MDYDQIHDDFKRIVEDNTTMVSYETQQLAFKLMEKHGPTIRKNMENRRKAQKLGYDTSKMTSKDIELILKYETALA